MTSVHREKKGEGLFVAVVLQSASHIKSVAALIAFAFVIIKNIYFVFKVGLQLAQFIFQNLTSVFSVTIWPVFVLIWS